MRAGRKPGSLFTLYFKFINQSIGVTFLSPNKKVTKEIGLRGKAELPLDTRSP